MDSTNEENNQGMGERVTRSHVRTTADAATAVNQYEKGMIVIYENLRWHVMSVTNMGNEWVYELEHKESGEVKPIVAQAKIQGRYKAKKR